ncbi:hypothetical protein AB1046_03700 [Promicromonospora sp. Populi]|uniref:hypothetical protein n=1 Tax=Promicromonospora sp. Populi TaxID=3239420 RepID=UPI0034E1B6B0
MSGPAPSDRRIHLASPDGAFSVTVVATGARVSSVLHTATGTEFLVRTPWADEEWSGTYLSDSSNKEWHRRYAGGWHTLVPHAGDARTLGGVEHPFHGEAAWRRWRVVEHDATSCTLEVVLRTTPFVVRRSVVATAVGVEVRQSITNQSDRDVAFSWTEHPAFSGALIGPSSQLSVGGDPVDIYFPRDGSSHGAFRTVLAEGRGTAELRNHDTGAAVVLRWDPELFPYLYVWQEHHQTAGFPWWGLMDTIALEPASRGYESDGGPLGPIVLAGGASVAASFGLELTAPGLLG